MDGKEWMANLIRKLVKVVEVVFILTRELWELFEENWRLCEGLAAMWKEVAENRRKLQ